jgi:hypothetical protein
MVSQSFKAIVFCISTSTIKTRVHFYPSAGSSSGHHAISCLFTLFGKGIEKRSVMLDGGRLNQPDGVRLEDAFPTLRAEASGVFGLEIELSCPQSRLPLQSSLAAVELVSPQATVMYMSVPFLPTGEQGVVDEKVVADARLVSPRRQSFMGVGLQDSFFSTSLVMVNSSDEIVRPAVFHRTGENALPLQVGTLAPHSAVEIPLEESLFKDSSPHECLWGLTRAEKVAVDANSITPETAYYLMYRDAVNKRPLSVCAL